MKSSSSVVPRPPIELMIGFTVDKEWDPVRGEGTDEGEEEGVVVMRVAAMSGFPFVPNGVVVVVVVVVLMMLALLFREGRFVAVVDVAVAEGVILFWALDCRGLGPGFERPFLGAGWGAVVEDATDTAGPGMYSDLAV